MPRIERNTAIDLRQIRFGVAIRIDAEILVIEIFVDIDKGILAGSRGNIDALIGAPGNNRIEKWRDFRYIVPVMAQLIQSLKKIGSRARITVGGHVLEQMDIHDVDIGRHDLLDLIFPEWNLPGPARAASEWFPGAAQLAAIRRIPYEHGRTDDVVVQVIVASLLQECARIGLGNY